LTKLDCVFPKCEKARKFDELSVEAKQFVKEVEEKMGVPVVLIGTGPDALDVIDRRK
jgi:adenylosuccinate synthase